MFSFTGTYTEIVLLYNVMAIFALRYFLKMINKINDQNNLEGNNVTRDVISEKTVKIYKIMRISYIILQYSLDNVVTLEFISYKFIYLSLLPLL